MKKEANNLAVYTEQGEVVIDANDPHYPDARVFVKPDQIVQLIGWLRDAREELEKSTAEG